jgi:hypothetical protein
MKLDTTLQNGLAVFYLMAAFLNAGFAVYYFRKKDAVKALVWTAVAGLFLIHTVAYFAHLGWTISPSVTRRIDAVMGPVSYTLMSVAGFILILYFRKFFTNPQVAFGILNLSLLFSGWAMTNPHFGGRDVMGKADNVPIAMLVFSVGFFTWLGLYRAVQNDERLAKGEPVLEKVEEEKVLVWPDLVYTELICMVIATFVLVMWSVLLKAPLEQPATSAKAPNPSKAPWYFLGLQEMLVYFDPWMAGVVLPTFIIIGMMAMPYIDFNQHGNGYFSFANRKFAISMYLFGFLVLWVTLIVMGTFLRGPNWNFFGPFEDWDPHKVDALNNVNVSEIFWLKWLGTPLDSLKERHGAFLGCVLRELPGFVLLFVYFLVLPPLLARTVLRPFFVRMGFIRFMILVTLMQFMASLPIKMVLRWTMNLKYIVALPEIFFNF